MWSKKHSSKHANREDGGDSLQIGYPADNANKRIVVASSSPRNQETQTYSSLFADDRTKRTSCRHGCCKKHHGGGGPTDSRRVDGGNIWLGILSWLPDLWCFDAPGDDDDDDDKKPPPKRLAKHCSDKGLPDVRIKAGQETRPAESTATVVVMPSTLEDASKTRKLPSDDKSCPCKSRPVWTEFLKPPKPKKRCRHCHKLT